MEILLFSGEQIGEKIENYIVKVGDEYGLDIKVMHTIEEINNSPIKYVLSRGIDRSILNQMVGKVRHNDLALTKLVDNKARTKDYLTRGGLGKYIPDTYSKPEDVPNYPVIVKDVEGSMGEHVYLCNKIEEVRNTINGNPDVTFLIEQYIGPNNGKAMDYRVYFIDGKARLYIKRENDGPTSNVSTGGGIEVINPIFAKELKQINDAIGLNLAAIDFTVDLHGNLKIFEINASPGIKAVYALGIDAYPPFFEWYAKYVKELEWDNK